MVTANNTEELHLARDERGHMRVYDVNLEPASQTEVLDGIRGGGVGHRHRWPGKRYPAWDDGPDPRRDPHWVRR